MHANSELLFRKYAAPLFRPDQTVLEIGPDGAPSTYRKVVRDIDLRWETLELGRSDRPDPPHPVSYVSEHEYHFPMPDDRYDIVLSGQVIEHVRKIWIWYHELARVCRSGGLVITICPVTWPYHEDPVDCWRIYPEGMKALCEDAGLEPVLVQCESVEPPLDLRAKRWYLTKQALKGLVGGKPFLAPLAPAWAPPVDTIAIARKT